MKGDAWDELAEDLAGRPVVAGQRYGRLITVSVVGRAPNRSRLWECRCDCGNTAVVRATSLKEGNTKSCGCLKAELLAAGNPGTQHGERASGAASPEIAAYYNARYRCVNPDAPQFADYGGRGILFRFESFKQFLGCLGRRPTSKHSLDRIDNDGHYEPGNVRWAVKTQQNANQRRTVLVEVGGFHVKRHGMGASDRDRCNQDSTAA
jgi:hypothetical protein